MNEKSPEVEGRFLMFTPPMSNDVQVFSGSFGAVGLGRSGTEAAAVEPAVELALGDAPLATAVDDVDDGVPFVSPSFVAPFVSGTFTALGFCIGIADFGRAREAMALARARWWGDLDARTIYTDVS
jgi:hypothetical protein